MEAERERARARPLSTGWRSTPCRGGPFRVLLNILLSWFSASQCGCMYCPGWVDVTCTTLMGGETVEGKRSAVGLKPCTQHFAHRARIDVARICMEARGASRGRKPRTIRARVPPRAGKFFFSLSFSPMTTTTSRATSSYKECCWSICSGRDRYKPTRFCSAISHASFLNVHPAL